MLAGSAVAPCCCALPYRAFDTGLSSSLEAAPDDDDDDDDAEDDAPGSPASRAAFDHGTLTSRCLAYGRPGRHRS